MWLGSQPRLHLATLPTPLQEARRLREALGGEQQCPRILIKRDDLTGLAFGGNKVRKLEFLVAAALQEGATALITAGAIQSNHVRLTAAAARVAGLRTHVVLTTNADEQERLAQGNLLLNHLLGADMHIVSDGTNVDMVMAEIAAMIKAQGERPYTFPIGGSNAIGVLGYVAATLELVGQLFAMGEAANYLYYASGSRGTQAGLELGKRLYSAPYQLYGIAVSGGEPEKTAQAVKIAEEAAGLLGVPSQLSGEAWLTDEGYIGEGYGIPTPECWEALRLLAHCEGIFLDPVYTGKAMAGLIDRIRLHVINPQDTVVFLHTGGTPALFAHAEHFSTRFPPESKPARAQRYT